MKNFDVITGVPGRRAVRLAAALWAVAVWAQTKVDLSAQSRQVNFGAASFTIPARTGSGIPASCTLGELFFRTDAAPGANLYGCTAANTWSLLGGSATQLGAGQISDLSVVRNSITQISVGVSCSPAAPCNAQLNDVLYTYADAKAATNPSGTGLVWVGVDVDGVRTAWHNLLSLTCTGWRCTAGASGFPADVLKLAQCTVSAGAFDPGGCTDLRSVYRRDAYKAGTGLTRTGGVFAINPVVVATTGAVTVGFSATPSFNFSSGNLQAITLAGNVTASSILNPVPAQSITFKICQDSTGGWTFQWPSNSAGGMTVGTAPGKCSVQSFVYDGIKWIATSTGASNL